jgi:predicted transcriptional regulator
MNRGGLVLVPLLIALGPGVAASQSVPADTIDLATGPYSEMRMLLQKTVFKVDVFTLRVRFDPETAARLEALASGRRYDSSIEDSIANVAIHAKNAWAVIEYLRDVDLSQYLDGVRKNMRRAVEAGLLSGEDYDMISSQLPVLYALLRERNIHRGDRIYYRIRGDTVRTFYRGRAGDTLLDHIAIGPERRLAVMGGYFAPMSSFRHHLIESLFDLR